MKHIVRISALSMALVLILSLTGCASMLKSMGGVSKDDLTAHDAELNAKVSGLTSRIEELNAALAKTNTALASTDAALAATNEVVSQMEEIKNELLQLKGDLEVVKLSTSEMVQIKASVDDLYLKVSMLSDETLLKLAQLIQSALAKADELPAEPVLEQPAEQPPAP